MKRALTDPAAVCQRLGLSKASKRQGGGQLVLCPAHGDKTPSCSVTVGPDGTLRVRCFSCDLAGDVFSLIAAVERLDVSRDFGEVLAHAADLAGISLAERPGASPRAPRAPRAPMPPPAPAGPPPLPDERFAEIVAPLLHLGRLDTAKEVAERGPSAVCADVVAYLRGRDLLELARAEGWAALPPPGPSQVSWVAMLVDLYGEEDVARTGLVPLDDDGKIAPRGLVQGAARLVIPWRRPDGVITTLQRRRLDGQRPKYVSPAGRAPRFPYGVELGAWDPDVPVAIVEGAIDVLALRELRRREGAPVVILGIQGTQGWRAEYGEHLRGRPVALALDGDEAGEAAVAKLVEAIEPWAPVRIERWRPAGGKDWAEQLAMRDEMKGAA